MIGVSALVQRVLHASNESISTQPSDPLAVVQWNADIAWALFGVALTEAGKESISPFTRICLRRLLQVEIEVLLGIDVRLPLGGVNGDKDSSDSLLEAIMTGDKEMIDGAKKKDSILYTED